MTVLMIFFPNVQSKIPKLPYASVDSITPFVNIKKDLILPYLRLLFEVAVGCYYIFHQLFFLLQSRRVQFLLPQCILIDQLP